MRKEDKLVAIDNIVALIEQYKNFYITDIEALDAENTSNLRRECFKSGIKLVVVKNTLLKLALQKLNDEAFAPLYTTLKGNTAIMLAEGANVPAKVIKKMTKGDKTGEAKPRLKAACVQESLYIGAENLDALVNIKSKEELIGDVIALLQSPAKNVISALQSSGHTIHGVLKTLQER